MLALKLDLPSAKDIWNGWAAAFTTPYGQQLSLEFRAAVLNTLTSTFITPAALSAQTPALAQWALHSIPVEFL